MAPLGAKFDRIRKAALTWKKPRDSSSVPKPVKATHTKTPSTADSTMPAQPYFDVLLSTPASASALASASSPAPALESAAAATSTMHPTSSSAAPALDIPWGNTKPNAVHTLPLNPDLWPASTSSLYFMSPDAATCNPFGSPASSSHVSSNRTSDGSMGASFSLPSASSEPGVSSGTANFCNDLPSPSSPFLASPLSPTMECDPHATVSGLSMPSAGLLDRYAEDVLPTPARTALASVPPAASPSAGNAYLKVPTFDEWWAAALRDSSRDAVCDIARVMQNRSQLPPMLPLMPFTGERSMYTIARLLSRFSCKQCYQPFDITAVDIVGHVHDMISIHSHLISGFKCTHCAHFNCIGCGVAVAHLAHFNTTKLTKDISLSWCCEVGRVFLIWALCCGVKSSKEKHRRPCTPAPPEPKRMAPSAFSLFKPHKKSTSNGSIHSFASGSSGGNGGSSSVGTSSTTSIGAAASGSGLATGATGNGNGNGLAGSGSGSDGGKHESAIGSAIGGDMSGTNDSSSGKVVGTKTSSKATVGASIPSFSSIQKTNGKPAAHKSPFSKLPSKTSSAKSSSSAKKATSHKSPAIPTGVGYGGSVWLWSARPDTVSTYTSASKSVILAEDEMYRVRYLALSRLLSSISSAVYFECSTENTYSLLFHFLDRSPLLTKAAELLRNTSIEDISKRHSLYEALLQFLAALIQRRPLAGLVSQPQAIYTTAEQLQRVCFSTQDAAILMAAPAETGKEKPSEREKTESLAMLMHRAAQLCWHVLRQANTHADDFANEDGSKMLDICHQITRLFAVIPPSASSTQQLGAPPTVASNSVQSYAVQSAGVAVASGSSESVASAEAARLKKIADWHRDHCLDDINDDQLAKCFMYCTQMKVAEGIPAKGRMKRLINDINVLRTSLPEGVFVRHSDTRLDSMKVLIVGPQGTPYEGGLFEFDMFCPETFPQQPPLMNLKTTGKGRIRFNPNLYQDGTVCLSLLGTWGNGQTWHPEHSTLLQVLVSIQSMVFCEEPYYNEPGRENRKDASASASENHVLQGHTIEHAMLYWLDNLPHEGSPCQTIPPDMLIWEDVVRQHFALSGKAIFETVNTWGGRRMVSELTAALKKHSFIPGDC